MQARPRKSASRGQHHFWLGHRREPGEPDSRDRNRHSFGRDSIHEVPPLEKVGTGTDDEPFTVLQYMGIKNGKSKTGREFELDEENLDVPTFLRTQG